MQIRSRIVKLKKEEEKANKRIKDMQRKQKFALEMQEFKAQQQMMIEQTYKAQKVNEDRNRLKFNMDR